MNIFQLQKKTRKAKNLVRRSNQQLTRVQAKGFNNEKENALQFRISKANTFLDKVRDWQNARVTQRALRSSLPTKKQRELGLIPSVELFNEWRAAGYRYVIQETKTDGSVTYPVLSTQIEAIRNAVKTMVDNKVNLATLKVFKVK